MSNSQLTKTAHLVHEKAGAVCTGYDMQQLKSVHFLLTFFNYDLTDKSTKELTLYWLCCYFNAFRKYKRVEFDLCSTIKDSGERHVSILLHYPTF